MLLKNSSSRWMLLTSITVVLVMMLLLAGLTTGNVVAQSNNTTTSGDAQSVCENPENTDLSQSRLYAPETQITADQPGQVAGGFQVAADSSCSIVISITMSVPSGMSISGASDIFSGGAGLVSGQFTAEPGDIKDIRANVYSENTGDRTVTADITYWPEGNQDMSQEIDGIQLSYTVEEQNSPPTDASENTDEEDGSDQNGGSSDDGIGPGFGLATALISLGGTGYLLKSRLDDDASSGK